MSVRDLEQSIKKIMEEHDRALSASTLSTLTGEPTWKLSKKLKKMEKNGDVKRHKTMKVRLYRLAK